VVTFGSFQRPGKLGEATLELWSKVLNAVPNSRMLIGAIDGASLQGRLTEYFAARGIEQSRLDFHPQASMNDYLALHHEVDILLDTYPFPGGTTANHGLLMGVPTLTMTGKSAASWQGAAILMRLGMKDWIAHDEAAFVGMAQYWAANLPDLAKQRSGLRQHFMTSPLNRPETVARGLEAALRIMWQRWCAGQPAESFQVNL
jgi:predicted O-linked N-acetylglucosamine transferase (SPINDLY family)